MKQLNDMVKNGEGQYVIQIGYDYYVVNEFTYNLVNFYIQGKTVDEICKILNMNAEEVHDLYSTLSIELEKGDYFTGNYNLDAPLRLSWFIENRCNLKCQHCYRGGGFNNSLSNDEKNEIAKKISASKTMEICISGGESLVNEKLPFYVTDFIEKGKCVHIFTNGYYLNSFIDQLPETLNKNMLKFEVSIDGLKEIHDKIRGDGIYDKVISNIIYAQKKGYVITTNTVLTNLNIGSIPKLFNTLHDLGIKTIQLSNLMKKGNALENNLEVNDQDSLSLYTKLKEQLNFDFYYADCFDRIHKISDKKDSTLGNREWKCCAGEGKLIIAENGDVKICPFLDGTIGNILTNDLDELWHSHAKNKLVKKLKEINAGKNVCSFIQY